MIKKLRLKIILLASVILFVTLAVIIAGIVISNMHSLTADADRVLDFLSKNEGRFPEKGDGSAPGHKPEGDPDSAPPEGEEGETRPEKNPGLMPPPDMSPETPYMSRYFSVLVGASGEIIEVDTENISAVDSSLAEEMAGAALGGADRGNISHYRYLKYAEGGGTRVLFLDIDRELDSAGQHLLAGVGVGTGGFLLLFLIVVFFSGRITAQIAESYEKQKRFITDAGHEMKTPLAVISANISLLSEELPESESVADIEKATERLTRLTAELSYLAKMDEEKALLMIELPFGEIVKDSALSHRARAQEKGMTLELDIDEGISIVGDSPSLEKLVYILMDNAVKYSKRDSEIRVTLLREGRGAVLTVLSHSEAPISREMEKQVFLRFWRADPARSSEVSGQGIGLSIAEAIVAAHGGRISASVDGDAFSVTAHFDSPRR